MLMVGLLGVFTQRYLANELYLLRSKTLSWQAHWRNSSDGIIKTIVEVLLTAVGAISIIMVVIGGIMFALSSGEHT